MKKCRIGSLAIAMLWLQAQALSPAQTLANPNSLNSGAMQTGTRSQQAVSPKAKQPNVDGSEPSTRQLDPLSSNAKQAHSGASLPDNAQPTSPSIARPDWEMRLDKIQALVARLSAKLDYSNVWSSRDVGYIVTVAVAVGGLFVSALALKSNRDLSLTQLKQSVRNERAKALRAKLDQFYGPLLHLRSTSALLYQIFRDRQQNPKEFRTLTALLAGVEFTGNDKVLLEEIIKIGEETEQLILKSSALVDEDLQLVLGRALTHYRILRLAHKGMLKGEPDKFSAHVYPRELDHAISKKISQIRKEVEELSKVELEESPTV